VKHKVSIVGAGFVGTACEIGFEKIASIKIHDKYKPTDSLETVVRHAEILFLALPTPMNEDGSCDTSIIEEVCHNIDNLAKREKIIVLKSTVPPGTTDHLKSLYPNHNFIFNPEFLTEKNFIKDFKEQDRIILGKTSEESLMPLDSLYSDFIKTQVKPAKIFYVKAKEAEMVKYVTNCFLATKLSFYNEIYQICQASSIEYDSVLEVLRHDMRLGKTHMDVPGPDGQFGWGLSCFPKDINALIAHAKDSGVDPLVLESAWTKNLMVREVHDWEKLAQVSGKYKKNDE
jgi:nucleotide sugar dehydrogenase